MSEARKLHGAAAMEVPVANSDSTFDRALGFGRASAPAGAGASSFTIAQTLVRFVLTMTLLVGLSASFAWQIGAMLR